MSDIVLLHHFGFAALELLYVYDFPACRIDVFHFCNFLPELVLHASHHLSLLLHLLFLLEMLFEVVRNCHRVFLILLAY